MKQFILLIGLLFAISSVNAQTQELDSLIDDIFFEDEDFISEQYQPKTYHFLLANSTLDTKTFFAGREIDENAINASSQVMYFNSKGFYAGVAGYWFSSFDPQYSMTIASTGYTHTPKNLKSFRLRAGYDHFFYNIGDTDFDPSYFGSFNLGITYRNKWFSARYDGIFLVGDHISSVFSGGINTRFTLYEFPNRVKIKFAPNLNLYFGREDVEYVTVSFRRETIEYIEEMGLMNTQLNFPLSFYYKGLDIGVSYRVNMPRSLDANYTYDTSSFFSFSIGYVWSLN